MAKKNNPQILEELFASADVKLASQVDPPRKVTLYEPAEDVWKKVTASLYAANTATELESSLQPFVSSLRGVSLVELRADGSPSSLHYMQMYLAQKRYIKNDHAKALAYFICDSRNGQYIVDGLNPQERELTRLLFEQIFVSVATLKQLMPGIDWYSIDRYSWRDDYTPTVKLPWCRWCSAETWMHRNDILYHHFYYLTSDLLSYFAPSLLPEVRPFPESKESLPEGLTTFSGERQLVSSYDILLSQQMQGAFDVDETLKMKVADVRRAIQLTGMRHFHPDDLRKDEDYGNALTLALPVMAYTMKIMRKPDDLFLMLRTAVCDMFEYFSPMTFCSRLLPHIGGFKKREMDFLDAREMGLRLRDILSRCGSGWLDVGDIYLSMLCYKQQRHYQMSVLSPRDIDRMGLTHKVTGDSLSGEDIVPLISKGLIGGLCCLLSGLGVVEVAYRPYQHGPEAEDIEQTPYDFIRYIRVTPLGRYALGLTDRYEMPKQERREYFVLDDEHLILRSIADPNPYLELVKDTSEYIGAQRFRMSPDSFLAKCSNEQDVQNRIQQFRQFVCPQPPQIWEEFFAEISRHVHPLQSLPSEEYRIYSIDSQNRSLLSLLTSDAELRRLIIRAEGYHFLVSKANHRKFVARLKTFGYLL